MAITLDGTNGITSPDFEPSSSTTPTNGLFLPTTNALGFATNSTERLRLDASGNLGLGVTPSAWAAGSGVQFQDGVSFTRYGYTRNAYFDGSNYRYISSAVSSWYLQAAGAHSWWNAPSGTAGNAISFTQAMTLDASGNLGIGLTNPSFALDIASTSASRIRLTASTGVNSAYLQLVNNGGNYYIGADNSGGSLTGSPGAAYSLNMMAVGAYPIIFSTSAAERARIDSSGNLLVGVTSSPQGKFNSVATANPGSNGNNGVFINTWSGDVSKAGLYVAKYDNNSTTSQIFVQFAINNNTLGSGQINANGAGVAAFGGFSDSRLKENITALPDQLANICALKPSEFDYKDGSGHQIGFIAQEMQEVYPDVVGEGEDGMLTITGWSKTEARLVKAIQELNQRLEALENK